MLNLINVHGKKVLKYKTFAYSIYSPTGHAQHSQTGARPCGHCEKEKLSAGRWHLDASALSVTADREKTLSFIHLFSLQTSLADTLF